jgi:hypothetical protein
VITCPESGLTHKFRSTGEFINEMKTKTASLVGILIIGMLMSPTISAFEKGENRIRNSDFEADNNTGEPPNEWALEKGG